MPFTNTACINVGCARRTAIFELIYSCSILYYW
jgi:hypothetical protein